MSFALQNYLVSWGPIFPFLIIEPEALEFFLGNFFTVALSLRLFFYFIFYFIDSILFYVKVLDPPGLVLCARLYKCIYFQFSTYRLPVRPTSGIEDFFFYPLYIFGFFVKDQLSVSVWFYFWVFSSITLINVSVSVWIPCNFYHCCSVV